MTGQGTSGAGYEYGLKMGLRAIERSSPCGTSATRLRCDATVAVVVLSDEDDQTSESASGGDNYTGAPDSAQVASFITQYTGKAATLFAIVGGNPKCSTAYNASKGYDAVVAGMPGSAGFSICRVDQTNNVNEIVRAAAGVSSAYVFSGLPISASHACATADETETLTLTCPVGQVVRLIEFASYGTPTGSCGGFVTSSCHAADSVTAVENACLDKSACAIAATSAIFGDPCSGTAKDLYVQATCGM